MRIPTFSRGWKIILTGLVLIPLLASCYGRFPLTRAVYKWNGEISDDKYIRSIVFWPLSIVYVGAGLADAVIVNVMEFWTGNRVVNVAKAQPDGSLAQVMAQTENSPARIIITRPGPAVDQFTIVRVSDRQLEVRNGAGTLVGQAWRTGQGNVQFCDAQGRILQTVPETELQNVVLRLSE